MTKKNTNVHFAFFEHSLTDICSGFGTSRCSPITRVRLFSFGDGALGHDDNGLDHSSPAKIMSLSRVRSQQVAAGEFHSLVLAADGSVYSFGCGGGGRLGHGDDTDQYRPLKISELDGIDIFQVSAGGTHSLAVGAKEGELYSWGRRSYGRLGLGPDRPWYNANQDTPKLVPLPRGVQIRHASAGGCHSLAVATGWASWGRGWPARR